MKLENIWISGAGRGIGKEIALAFAPRKVCLLLSSRTAAQLNDVAAECRSLGSEAYELQLDVSDPDAVNQISDKIMSTHGAVDLLIANAGVGYFGPVAELSVADWNAMIGTNLSGTFHMVRAALPGMIEKGSGRIVIIASTAARVAFPGAAAYCASKAGVIAFANSLREELRETGIRVNAILPGAVASPFWDSIESDLDPARMIPMRRIAEAVLQVADEDGAATLEEIVIRPPGGNL